MITLHDSNRLSILNILFTCFIISLASNLVFCQADETALQSQNAVNNQTSLPASPEAAGLGEYGNFPISPYTGSANVSVPIHSIKGNRLGLDVNINFQTSGFKVEDRGSGILGMGWVMNAGGSITRTVKGAPDMHYNYYDQKDVFEDYLTHPGLSSDLYEFYYKTVNGEYETQPDTYFFSFNGRSGKFHINADLNEGVILTEDSDLIIEPTFADVPSIFIPHNNFKILSKFVITDEYGTKYYFENAEYTVLQYDDTRDGLQDAAYFNHEYNSTWHLTKIESHDGLETIDFTYDVSNTNYDPPINQNNFEFRNFIVGLQGHSSCVTENPAGTLGTGGPTFNYIANRHFLSEIEYSVSNNSREKLVFNYTSNTCTYAHDTDRQLNNIEIHLGVNAGHHELTHHFNYECRSGRLFLEDTGLRSDGENAYNLRPPYRFVYNTRNLPSPLSLSQDKWGYYNGASNTSLIPSSTVPGTTYNGANRSSNGTFAQAKNLTQVIYPTGGYTRYSYEANTVPDPSSSFVLNDCTGPCQTFDSCSEDLLDCGISNGCADPSEDSYPFTITNQIRNDGYLIIESELLCTSGPQQLNSGRAQLNSSNLTNQSPAFIEVTDINGNSVGSYNEPVDGSVLRDTIKISNWFNVQTGASYTLTIRGFSARVTASVKIGTLITGPDIPIGGVRIKSIKHFDRGNTFLKGRSYKYNYQSTGRSSGKIIQQPSFEEVGTYVYEAPTMLGGTGCGLCCDYSYTTVRLSASPSYPLGSFDGSFYGYSRVEEFDLLNNSETEVEGKRVYHFHNNKKAGSDVDVVENGKLSRFELFDANNLLVRRELNTYAFDIGENQRQKVFMGFQISTASQQDNKIYLFRHTNGNYVFTEESGGEPGSIFSTRKVYNTKWDRLSNDYMSLVNYSTFLTEKLTTHYYYDNSNQQTGAVTEVQQFDYSENLNYVQPSSSTSINSNGDVHRMEYDYLDSYVNSNLVRFAMDDRNLILPAWRSRLYYNNSTSPIDGQETRFSFYTTLNGKVTSSTTDLLYPRYVYNYERTWGIPSGTNTIGSLQTGRWDEQVEAKEYDAQTGKPTKIRRRHWPLDDVYAYDDVGNTLSHTYGIYQSNWTYHPETYLLEKQTAIDGTSQNHNYDGLLRPASVLDNDRGVESTYDYVYGTHNAVVTSIDFPKLGDTNRELTSYAFMDDIGRAYQTIRYAQGPTIGESVLTGRTYDKVGRVSQEFEPRAIANQTSPATLSGDKTTFAYDGSPLNRQKSVTDPMGWVSRTDYGTNEGTEVAGYLPNELYKIDSYDGNNTRSTVFTDKRGNEVFSRRYSLVNGQVTDHDNVQYFDGKDRLTTTVPPGATTSNIDLLFRKAYAGNDLLTYEHIPGKGALTYINSLRGQLIYRQDPLMKSHNTNLHFAMQYDNYGNLLKEGWRSSSIPTNDSQLNGVLSIESANHTYGTAGIEKGKMIKSVKNLISSNVSGVQNSTKYTCNFNYNNVGLLAKKEFNHPLSPAINSLVEDYIYDSADNQIQTIFDFTNITTDPIEFNLSTTIDHANRTKREWFGQGTGAQKELSSYTYDGKELVDKLIIGQDIQEIDYLYQPNRLLVSQYSPDFKSFLFYDTPGQGRIPRRNGDISSWYWNNDGDEQAYLYSYDGLDRLTHSNNENGATAAWSSNYSYDMRGNLTNLSRRNGSAQQIDLLNYSYTSGNRLFLINDQAPSSVRAQGYDGSSSRAYFYDANGNIRIDQSRGITTTYNYMDLPYTIIKDGNNNLKYHYDFGGTLLSIDQEIAGNTTTTHYIGNVEYEGTSIKRINHAHGYIQGGGSNGSNYLTGNQFSNIVECHDFILSDENILSPADVDYLATDYIELKEGFSVQQGAEFLADFNSTCGTETFFWTIKDHKMNVRTILNDGGNVVHGMDYYPFNLRHDYDASPAYEWNVEGALEQTGIAKHLDVMAFRTCDRLTGRFNSVDKLASEMSGYSPYNYGFDNPIKFIDPTGLAPECDNCSDPITAFFNDVRDNGPLSAIGNLFDFGGFHFAPSVKTISSVNQASDSMDSFKESGKENLDQAVSEFGSELQEVGEVTQEVGGNAVLASAAMAVTPASPASPVVATAGGITSVFGAAMILTGDFLEDGQVSMSNVKNTAASVATRGANNKTKTVINKTKILGRSGNSFFNNIIKSASDGFFMRIKESITGGN